MTLSPIPRRSLLAAAATLMLALPGSARGEDPQPADDAPPEVVGIELGDFILKDFRPIQGERVRLSFTLHASTPAERVTVFEKRLESRRMRLRDQVITAMRLAAPREFEDPELRLIRRRLQLRLARSLPELEIDGIYFSDFRYLVN